MKKENMNTEKTLHRNCDPHDAAHCDINEHPNLEPVADDCGHYVAAGPGVGKPAGGAHPADGTITAGFTPDSEKGNRDQDPHHGPGAKN